MAAVLSLLMHDSFSMEIVGAAYAVASGAVTSGIGYVIWYSVMPTLKTMHAATVQLSVPIIAALGGVICLDEPLTLRLSLASLAVLGGILLVLLERKAESVPVNGSAVSSCQTNREGA